MKTKESLVESELLTATNFQNLVNTPLLGKRNAIGWLRELEGDFSEIISHLSLDSSITSIEIEELKAMRLSEQGMKARDAVLKDWMLLEAHGASPTLNLISHYDSDKHNPFFPLDVYSFHVDRADVPTDTFLCTYYGAPSEILLNEQAIQKISIPEIRQTIKEVHRGTEEDFELFLSENFYDLHYQPLPIANPISLGVGNLWRLAVDYPGSLALPCIHRAPKENKNEPRLLMIC